MATTTGEGGQRDAWSALVEHHRDVGGRHLRELFAADPGRGERLAVDAEGLYLDMSKNRITDETIALLLALARERGLRERIDAMFAGEHINVTEDRAVLHVALRAPRGSTIFVDGHDVVPDVHDVLDRMSAFAQRVRAGEWRGHTGRPIRNVLNIGIGGSDLGPVMAYEALRHYSQRELNFRFVSCVVNVLEDTMNSVSSASRSRVASTKSVPSTLETKRKFSSRWL